MLYFFHFFYKNHTRVPVRSIYMRSALKKKAFYITVIIECVLLGACSDDHSKLADSDRSLRIITLQSSWELVFAGLKNFQQFV